MNYRDLYNNRGPFRTKHWVNQYKRVDGEVNPFHDSEITPPRESLFGVWEKNGKTNYAVDTNYAYTYADYYLELQEEKRKIETAEYLREKYPNLAVEWDKARDNVNVGRRYSVFTEASVYCGTMIRHYQRSIESKKQELQNLTHLKELDTNQSEAMQKEIRRRMKLVIESLNEYVDEVQELNELRELNHKYIEEEKIEKAKHPHHFGFKNQRSKNFQWTFYDEISDEKYEPLETNLLESGSKDEKEVIDQYRQIEEKVNVLNTEYFPVSKLPERIAAFGESAEQLFSNSRPSSGDRTNLLFSPENNIFSKNLIRERLPNVQFTFTQDYFETIGSGKKEIREGGWIDGEVYPDALKERWIQEGSTFTLRQDQLKKTLPRNVLGEALGFAAARENEQRFKNTFKSMRMRVSSLFFCTLYASFAFGYLYTKWLSDNQREYSRQSLKYRYRLMDNEAPLRLRDVKTANQMTDFYSNYYDADEEEDEDEDEEFESAEEEAEEEED